MSERELPLPDYDELPFGSLQHRVRALSAEDLRTLLQHEREHANRVPVVELLTNRVEELERGAQPSEGAQDEMPEAPGHSRHGSPVGPSGPAPTSRRPAHGTIGETGKGADHS